MALLAQLQHRTSETLYRPVKSLSQASKSEAARALDADLLKWRQMLTARLDLNRTSLKEQEPVTKRKIMLKLRSFPD